MSMDTEVRVLHGDAACQACNDEMRRAIAEGKPPVDVVLAPHAATFLVKRETFTGALLLTTACERSIAETLFAFELAAYPADGTCGDELTPGVACVARRHHIGENHRAGDGRTWR